MQPEARGLSGTVFDVQNYCLYDGPGIRTGLFLKGCPLRCFWCHNPEGQKPEAPGGEELTVAQAVERAAADRDFFAASKGGVTVSGGEPTLQSAYLLRVLRSLKESGLHTALETCGHFSEKLLSSLLETVDLFLFDLKQIDDRKHRAGTGCGNEKIHDNFRALLARAGAERTTVRIPLVPGYNTSEDDIAAFVAFLREAGYEGEVHLMPYHGWAKSKYELLGRLADYRDLSTTRSPDMDRIIGQFAAGGLVTRVYG